MDFSSSERALKSLGRRRPPLPSIILDPANELLSLVGDEKKEQQEHDTSKSDDYLNGILALLQSTNTIASRKEEEEEEKGASSSSTSSSTSLPRWEGLAVGILLATRVLTEDGDCATKGATKKVYIDGPRVPTQTTESEQQVVTPVPETTTMTESKLPFSFSKSQVSSMATKLYQTCLEHLEHPEPRVRTFVAKAVGAHVAWTLEQQDNSEIYAIHGPELNTVYQSLLTSIRDHIQSGRDATKQQYSKSSTGALDDTTGWRALETNWQCLACWIASMGSAFYTTVLKQEEQVWTLLLSDCEYSVVTHVNRHVRAASIAVLEQLVLAAGSNSTLFKEHLYNPQAPLRTTVVTVLKAGLADNWSQVRMAASVLNRVFWITLKQNHPSNNNNNSTFANEQDYKQNLALLYPILLPRMCLNRFYLAQGVKLYSHQTWKLVFPEQGLEIVAETIAPICRYYVKMCDADNHVVREAACQAVAELAVKLGRNTDVFRNALQPHVPILLQALLMCFHDESWPVRDEACLACGTFCMAYPEECKPELSLLWDRWTEQLTDQIWSVRADAAVALADAVRAYGPTFQQRVMDLIQTLLPSAKEQPSMTMEEYKALQNNIQAHTDSQLYSCGSLAPKLRKHKDTEQQDSRKAGAGRIGGCSSCAITRPKQPWEATDGCLYLIRELVEACNDNGENNNVNIHSGLVPLDDSVLVPLITNVMDVCRVSHFPQGDELRATLWKQLPDLFRAIGKQRVKRMYLELVLDLLLRNIESRTASQISKHAACTCAYELSQFIGPSIFLGRIYDDYQRQLVEDVLRERKLQETREQQHQRPGGLYTANAPLKQFSPFEPPGLLDNLDLNMNPGMQFGMMPMQQQQQQQYQSSEFGVHEMSKHSESDGFSGGQEPRHHQQRPGIDDTFTM